MTDEEKNVGTERWPSKENIVSFFFLSRGTRGCTFTHTGKTNKISCGPWSILLKVQLPEMPSSFTVSFCATLPSSVDLISIDAGHGGKDDVVGGDHACACKYDFSRCLVF
jgi:N-acetylmuramoyl-L-alanine amidase